MISLSETEIDPDDTAHQTMLRNLQGNILKPHGRLYVRLLLLAFQGDRQLLPNRLRQATTLRPTSAWEQQLENQQHKSGQRTGTFRSFFLTARGMGALGLLLTDLDRHPGGAALFKRGMVAAAGDLGDDIGAWDSSFRSPLDAMVLLADDDLTQLDRASADVLTQLRGFATCTAQEAGQTLFDSDHRRIEHFGHVDGRSQPVFFKADLQQERAAGTESWDPAAPLGLVLARDSFTGTPDCFGSYLVLRKLEQNVLRYHELLSELGKQLPAVPQELLDAWVVGRFTDGTPVDLSATRSQPPAPDPAANDFVFANDLDGARCPLQAHLRKANPRGGTVGLGTELDSKDLGEEKMHRIVRRGIPYGARQGQQQARPALLDRPATGVGLLFMCFQSDIANQFAFIQQRWANNREFQVHGAGFDTIIGSSGNANFTPQKWSSAWNTTPDKSFAFGEVVKVKGGEFFFAPSLAFFAP
jgi:Dyp-type peroxidase family